MSDDETGEEIGDIFVLNNHEVQWMIEDFFSYKEADKYYCSPSFCNELTGAVFYITVFPNGESSQNSVGQISLYLQRQFDEEEDDTPAAVGVCFTFGMKKMDGVIEQLGPECTWVFDEDHLEFGKPKLLRCSELQERKFEFGPQWGTMMFSCTLWTEGYFVSPGRYDALCRDLNNLFNSKRGSDVTLVLQGKEFSVHKTILSARSSVFATMFEVNMEEKRTGLVEIKDCDPVIFGEFLTYLYSGRIENGSRNTLELYKIADKYDVGDLKSYCRIAIMTHLSIENVLDVIKFGRLFNEHDIVLRAKDFNKNYNNTVD